MSSVDNQRLSAPWLDTLCTDNRANFEVTAYLDFNKVRQMAHELRALRASATEVEPVAWQVRHWRGQFGGWSSWNIADMATVKIVQDTGCTHNGFEAELRPLYAQPSLVDGVGDEMVERAAEVIWNDLFGARGGAWDNPPANSISGIQIRTTARAALTAALSHTDGEDGK